MKRLALIAAVLTVFCLTLFVVKTALAEMNLNLYLGMSNASINESSATDLKGGRSSVIGGRLQYWLRDTEFLGFGFDVSGFKTGDINLLTESGLAILRIPLGKDYQYPAGRFYPYLGVGPALVSGADTMNLALDFRGGIAWYFDLNLALFAEHKVLNSMDFDAQQFIGGISFKF